MRSYSTREAARKLGMPGATLARHIALGKLPTPEVVITGKTTTHRWTDEDIGRVRKLLPKIANGRKTRYKRKESAVSNQQSAKTRKKAQARVPAPQKKK